MKKAVRLDECDTWYAYECVACGIQDLESGGSGVVFDVRRSGAVRFPLPVAMCPVCGMRCRVRATWDADADGFKTAKEGRVSNDEKQKVAEMIADFGDQQRDMLINSIKLMIRTVADSAESIAGKYEQDPWAKEWVDLVNRAIADLRAAEARVQIQPLAPHGKIPS